MKLRDVFSWVGEISFAQLWKWYGYTIALLCFVFMVLALSGAVVYLVLSFVFYVPVWIWLPGLAVILGLISFEKHMDDALDGVDRILDRAEYQGQSE